MKRMSIQMRIPEVKVSPKSHLMLLACSCSSFKNENISPNVNDHSYVSADSGESSKNNSGNKSAGCRPPSMRYFRISFELTRFGSAIPIRTDILSIRSFRFEMDIEANVWNDSCMKTHFNKQN